MACAPVWSSSTARPSCPLWPARCSPGCRCSAAVFHLARAVYKAARYTDGTSHELASDFGAQLDRLLTNAYRAQDLAAARQAYDLLIDDAEGCGALGAAAHLRGATDEVFTFLTHPDAGRLVFGDKG